MKIELPKLQQLAEGTTIATKKDFLKLVKAAHAAYDKEGDAKAIAQQAIKIYKSLIDLDQTVLKDDYEDMKYFVKG